MANKLEDYYKLIDEISRGHRADMDRIRTSLAHVELAASKRSLVNELLNYVQDLENYQSKMLKFMFFTGDMIAELKGRIKEAEATQEDFNRKSREYDGFMTEVKGMVKARADAMQELEKEKFDSAIPKD